MSEAVRQNEVEWHDFFEEPLALNDLATEVEYLFEAMPTKRRLFGSKIVDMSLCPYGGYEGTDIVEVAASAVITELDYRRLLASGDQTLYVADEIMQEQLDSELVKFDPSARIDAAFDIVSPDPVKKWLRRQLLGGAKYTIFQELESLMRRGNMEVFVETMQAIDGSGEYSVRITSNDIEEEYNFTGWQLDVSSLRAMAWEVDPEVMEIRYIKCDAIVLESVRLLIKGEN